MSGSSGNATVNWDAVKASARLFTGEGLRGRPAAYAGLDAKYQGWMRDFSPRMAEISGREPTAAPVEVVAADRTTFINAMVDTMQHLTAPLTPQTAASGQKSVGSRAAEAAYGFALSRLSKQVFGVFVPAWQSGDGVPRLYMVQPNIERAAAKVGVDPDSFAKYVLFHEGTHKWQFTEHAWLDGYLEGLYKRFTGAYSRVQSIGTDQSFVAGRMLLELWELYSSFAPMQAAMSVIEGYAMFVMDAAGSKYIDDYDAVFEGWNRLGEISQQEQSLVVKALRRVLSVDMKMKQYSEGRKFCDAVVVAGGRELLDKVWQGPQYLPSLQEIRQPERWIKRMEGLGLAA